MSFLNHSRIPADPIPGVRAAGRNIAVANEGTHICMQHNENVSNAPGTPEHIRKYRKSF